VCLRSISKKGRRCLHQRFVLRAVALICHTHLGVRHVHRAGGVSATKITPALSYNSSMELENDIIKTLSFELAATYIGKSGYTYTCSHPRYKVSHSFDVVFQKQHGDYKLELIPHPSMKALQPLHPLTPPHAYTLSNPRAHFHTPGSFGAWWQRTIVPLIKEWLACNKEYLSKKEDLS